MDIFQSILLGIIQGFTEWLPISSSGHLVLAQESMGLDVPVAFDVMLHFATAFVIIFIFLKEIKLIIKGVFSPANQKGKKEGQNTYLQRVRKDPHALFGWWIIIGTIPIVVIGLLFRDIFAGFFNSVFIVALALIGTGVVLTLSSAAYITAHRKRLNVLDAYTVGFGQALALVPGLSRSGMTIGFGLMRNIERETAAKYSILLSVPAIIGAAALEMPQLFREGAAGMDPMILLVGGITAFVVGYIAVHLLLLIVRKAWFHYFAIYCFGLAIILLTLA
jgi:undecaprenyl-diphosphatase